MLNLDNTPRRAIDIWEAVQVVPKPALPPSHKLHLSFCFHD